MSWTLFVIDNAYKGSSNTNCTAKTLKYRTQMLLMGSRGSYQGQWWVQGQCPAEVVISHELLLTEKACRCVTLTFFVGVRGKYGTKLKRVYFKTGAWTDLIYYNYIAIFIYYNRSVIVNAF